MSPLRFKKVRCPFPLLLSFKARCETRAVWSSAHQRALAPTGDRLVAKNEDDDRLVAINIDATAPPPPLQRAIRPLDTKPPAPTPNRDLSFVLIPINRPPPIPTHASLGDCAIMGIVMGLGNSINTEERTFRVVGPRVPCVSRILGTQPKALNIAAGRRGRAGQRAQHALDRSSREQWGLVGLIMPQQLRPPALGIACPTALTVAVSRGWASLRSGSQSYCCFSCAWAEPQGSFSCPKARGSGGLREGGPQRRPG